MLSEDSERIDRWWGSYAVALVLSVVPAWGFAPHLEAFDRTYASCARGKDNVDGVSITFGSGPQKLARARQDFFFCRMYKSEGRSGDSYRCGSEKIDVGGLAGFINVNMAASCHIWRNILSEVLLCLDNLNPMSTEPSLQRV